MRLRRVLARVRRPVLGRPDLAQPDVGAAPFRVLLAECLEHDLEAVQVPKVAVISDRPRSAVESWLRGERPGLLLVRPVPGDHEELGLHAELAAVGSFDLIVDETEAGEQFFRASTILLYLRPGGVLLLRRPRRPAGRSAGRSARRRRRERRALAALTSGIADDFLGPEQRHRRRTNRLTAPVPRRELFSRAVGEIQVRDGHVKLVNRLQAWPKIREEWSTRLLEQRGPEFGRVLSSGDPQVFTARGSISYGESGRRGPHPDSWTVPALLLREYRDVISSPGQLIYKDDVILPESYRHNQSRRLRHEVASELARGFADPRTLSPYATAPGGNMRLLRGSFYHLDNSYRGHFGHVVTESLSKLWAWPEQKAADPGLKVLLHTNKRPDLMPYELEMYEAAGVREQDIVLTEDPVRVERLTGVTPMFSNPKYIHPGIVDVWDRVGDALAAKATDAPRPRRIFVARGSHKRLCRNDAEVKDFFERLGFVAVYPEDHPLCEQVRLFREADVLAGYAGSAMFTLAFCPTPKRVVQITSESYTHQNEVLIAGVRGHELAVAWCRSEAPHREDGGRVPGYQDAAFTFDFAREGEFVRGVLDAHPATFAAR